jgi:hypothetical protein
MAPRTHRGWTAIRLVALSSSCRVGLVEWTRADRIESELVCFLARPGETGGRDRTSQ